MARDRDPVEWLLGNRELLVVLFAVVVWILNRVGAARKARDAAPGSARPAESATEEVARTRRVQEEVRRRIEERRGLAVPAPPVTQPFEPPLVVEEPPPMEDAVQATRDAEEQVLKRQRDLERELGALETARAAALVSARAARQTKAAAQTAGPPNPWLAELRNPAGVRRAVVLREILGAPLALR